jgi:hypothetical protein
MFQSTIALVSGLLIVSALFFGVMAMAIAGLLIGFAGAVLASFRQPEARAVVALEARRTGRGWSVDPSGR